MVSQSCLRTASVTAPPIFPAAAAGGGRQAMDGSGRPRLSVAGALSIAFLSAILAVLLAAASYNAWQARRLARRSHRSARPVPVRSGRVTSAVYFCQY